MRGESAAVNWFRFYKRPFTDLLCQLGFTVATCFQPSRGVFYAQVTGLSTGYHLLRCFLASGAPLLCVKSPLAYVEAEFFVASPTGVEPRSFMFGQPSIAVLQPRAAVTRARGEVSVVCDFFVNNCEVANVAHGCVLPPCPILAGVPSLRPSLWHTPSRARLLAGLWQVRCESRRQRRGRGAAA